MRSVTAAVVVIGLALTATLSLGARSIHNSNENRLLHQRVREAAAVVTASLPSVQTPLSSASVLAEATNGNRQSFVRAVSPMVSSGRPFASVSLWRIGASTSGPVIVVGRPLELTSEGRPAVAQMLRAGAQTTSLSVQNLLDAPDRRLGYAAHAPNTGDRFVVYAEVSLPKDRRAAIDKNSAFADLGYALFLGARAERTQLLASSTGGAVLHGRQSSATVPFGDSQLLVVMTPHKELGGDLLARLPLAFLLAGFVLTAAAAFVVNRLARRRLQAEQLATENARLYNEQRSVADTLQHNLLPELPDNVNGVQVAARYLAGVEGIDIGGDWYDIIRVNDDQVMIAVGDVSGRGLEAATIMASLRFAIRAYAAQGARPGEILTQLSDLLSIKADRHFATVLCGLVDVASSWIVWASAGHLEPLIVGREGAEFVKLTTGLPVGVRRGQQYHETKSEVAPGATLMLYTDGLVERRGESLDVGLARIKNAADANRDRPLDELLDALVRAAIPTGSDDDTALIGLRWPN